MILHSSKRFHYLGHSFGTNTCHIKWTSRRPKLRLGIAGGEWLKMVSNETARTNFANNVKNVLISIIWMGSICELTNYSKAIVKTARRIRKKCVFTVSLHPVSYKITWKQLLLLILSLSNAMDLRRLFFLSNVSNQTVKLLLNMEFLKINW